MSVADLIPGVLDDSLIFQKPVFLGKDRFFRKKPFLPSLKTVFSLKNGLFH
jgi:hypothetical protein